MTQTDLDLPRLVKMNSDSNLPTSRLRRPDFFIVGAPRCGTTALYTYLRRHPAVFMPDLKEPHHFCDDLDPKHGVKSVDDYLRLFETAPLTAVVGEASVFHLVSTVAAQNIYQFNPDARIVAMLRDPIEMIHSNHLKNLSLGIETESDFGKALELEPDRFDGPLASIVRGNDGFKLHYRANTRFVDQLKRYYAVFGRDRVFTIVYDDLKNAPGDLYRRLCLFLEIEPIDPGAFEVVNQNIQPRSKVLDRFLRRPPRWASVLSRAMTTSFRQKLLSRLMATNTVARARDPIPIDIRRRLAAELRPEVDRLERLLGRDLAHWCRADGI